MVADFKGLDWFGQVYLEDGVWCFIVGYSADGQHLLIKRVRGFLFFNDAVSALHEYVASAVPLVDEYGRVPV